MNVRETDQKITPDHLARKAMIYLRQSSLQQVSLPYIFLANHNNSIIG